MLTVENRVRTQRLTLRLRRKARQTLWSRPFLIALGISLILHLSGWVLFRFPHMQLSSLNTHTPVVVDSHLFDASAPATEAYLGSHPSKPPLPSSILIPISTSPALPSLRSPSPHNYLSAQSTAGLALSASSGSLDLETLTKRLPLSIPLDPEHVDIQLSGSIVDYTPSPPNSVWHPNTGSAQMGQPSAVRYSIQAQPQTGQLFWWERVDDLQLPDELLAAADTILRQLRLQIVADVPLVTGEITLTFYPERWQP